MRKFSGGGCPGDAPSAEHHDDPAVRYSVANPFAARAEPSLPAVITATGLDVPRSISSA
jgi:hypothetical protein